MTRRADVAEDISQETFLALMRAPGRFSSERGTMKSYLLSIARNLALKQYRNRVDQWDEVELSFDPRRSIDIGTAVADAVTALPELQREALVLFEYEGVTLEELARIVDADVGTVKSRLHRARTRLKRVLAPWKTKGHMHGAH
jgi:RNA polymerase sigma-70 factor (ECF subfamily)